jgi:hypothetical protein
MSADDLGGATSHTADKSEQKVRPSCRHQRLKVQLLAVDALAHGARLLPIPVGAAHMHLPSKAPRDP